MNIAEIIEQLIIDLKSIETSGKTHWNERYLHHKFSYLVQEETDYKISITDNASKLHPEWATAIKGIRNDGGVYALIQKEDGSKKYVPRETFKDGSSGFIDFAIGDFYKPDYAIEFKMAAGMDKKGFSFDYMKLMDSRNKFTNAISLSVIYSRKKELEKKELDENLEIAISELKEKGYLSDKRTISFFVVQIIKGEQPHIWKCDDLNEKFKQINDVK